MTEDQKIEIAIFRYGVVSEFVNGVELSRPEKRRMIKERCARKWYIPYSEKTSISPSTIKRWIRIYKNSGRRLTSLYPQSRSDQGQSRVLDEDTCMAIVNLRQKLPAVNIEELMSQMHSRGLVTPGIELKTSTVYRFLHKNNLMDLTARKPVDRRRFEAELPNDLWQSDVMHGPRVLSGDKLRKTYLIAIIDDHSRLIVYARFYLSESLPYFLDSLYHALAKRGLPRKLFVDNGPAFRSKKLEYITAQLNITLIHAKPYTPQSKGKIERWFKTVRSSFLPTFTQTTDLNTLNQGLIEWIDSSYQRRKHGATGETPFARFTKKLECPRLAPSKLTDYFRTVARRKVAKDRTIILNGKLYEGPVALIGKRVELLYHDSNLDQIEIMFNQKSYGILKLVDVNVNCRVKRDKNNNADLQIKESRCHNGSLFGVRKEI